MTTANPSKSKIRRAMALRKGHSDFIQAVDEEQNAPVVNEYDQMYGIRKDKVEVVWEITGRGKSQ